MKFRDVICKIPSPFTERELKSKGLSALQAGDERERASNYGDAKSLRIVLNERYAPDEREIAITRVIEIATMN